MPNTSTNSQSLELACKGVASLFGTYAPSLAKDMEIEAFFEEKPFVLLSATSPAIAKDITEYLSSFGIIATVEKYEVRITEPQSLYALSEYHAIDAEVNATLDKANRVLDLLRKDPSKEARKLEDALIAILCNTKDTDVNMLLNVVSHCFTNYAELNPFKAKEIKTDIFDIERDIKDTYINYNDRIIGKALEKEEDHRLQKRALTIGYNRKWLGSALVEDWVQEYNDPLADADDRQDWQKKVQKTIAGLRSKL